MDGWIDGWINSWMGPKYWMMMGVQIGEEMIKDGAHGNWAPDKVCLDVFFMPHSQTQIGTS